MQNSILEQVKVAESGADYMEQVAQVKYILSDRTALKNNEFYLQKKFPIRSNRVSLHSLSTGSSVSSFP